MVYSHQKVAFAFKKKSGYIPQNPHGVMVNTCEHCYSLNLTIAWGIHQYSHYGNPSSLLIGQIFFLILQSIQISMIRLFWWLKNELVSRGRSLLKDLASRKSKAWNVRVNPHEAVATQEQKKTRGRGPTRWCPPVISWFISPLTSSIYHQQKP